MPSGLRSSKRTCRSFLRSVASLHHFRPIGERACHFVRELGHPTVSRKVWRGSIRFDEAMGLSSASARVAAAICENALLGLWRRTDAPALLPRPSGVGRAVGQRRNERDDEAMEAGPRRGHDDRRLHGGRSYPRLAPLRFPHVRPYRGVAGADLFRELGRLVHHRCGDAARPSPYAPPDGLSARARLHPGAGWLFSVARADDRELLRQMLGAGLDRPSFDALAASGSLVWGDGRAQRVWTKPIRCNSPFAASISK